MEIYLQRMIYSNNDLERMEKILNDDELANQFKNINDEVMKSICTYFIKKAGEDIGYIFLLKEDINEALFINMGIKNCYANKGYAKQALRELKSKVLTTLPVYGSEEDLKILPLLAKIKKENEKAIKIFSEYSSEIYSNENYKTFLFPSENEIIFKKNQNKILSYIKGK